MDVDFVAASLLEPGSPVRHEIDPSRLALAGQSDGGESVLAASAHNGAPGVRTYQAVVATSDRPLVTTTTLRNPPILVIHGSADPIEPLVNGQQAFADASPPKYLAVIAGGGHLDPFESQSRWFGAIVALTDAFWDLYLRGHGSVQGVVAAGNRDGISSTVTRPSPLAASG